MAFKSIKQILDEHKIWVDETFLVEDDTITILPNELDYWIAWSRLDTKHKLLGWIYHLSAKTWMTSAMLHQFMEICRQKFGYDLDCP